MDPDEKLLWDATSKNYVNLIRDLINTVPDLLVHVDALELILFSIEKKSNQNHPYFVRNIL